MREVIPPSLPLPPTPILPTPNTPTKTIPNLLTPNTSANTLPTLPTLPIPNTSVNTFPISNTESNSRYRTEIKKYLQNPAPSWRKMFREQGISETPTIDEVLSLLGKTAGGNQSLETETSSYNPKTYKPTKAVRDDAMKGIRLSHEHNYPSYNGIGLARAIQLAVEPTVWKRSMERMSAFFGRNKRYENLSGFGNDKNPSKSYLAWLNWGGTPARDWVASQGF